MFKPSRLTAARKRRGWSVTHLADEAHISRRSLSLFENGKRVPTPDNVRHLAAVLNVEESFFAGADIDEIPERAVSFRALAKMPAGVRDRGLMSGRVALLIDEWIDSRFDLPGPNVPLLEQHDPEIAAMELRAQWGLGERPISNMIHLVEAHGGRIYSLTNENTTLDGFSMRWAGRPYIFLSTVKSGERGRFDVAHELGHLVLQHGDRENQGPAAEREADRFASAFLMPRGSVLAQGLRNATVPKILVARKHWKVSAMAMAVRANQLDLMSEWAYRSLMISLSQQGYRSKEHGGMPSRESSQLLTKVLGQLRAQGSGIGEIARDLGLSTAEVADHMFGLVTAGLPNATSQPHAANERAEPNAWTPKVVDSGD